MLIQDCVSSGLLATLNGIIKKESPENLGVRSSVEKSDTSTRIVGQKSRHQES